MAYQQKENTGALFINDKRETDKHPNAKGSALIDGVEYWVSAWTNRSEKGTVYQSLAFQKKEPKTDQGGVSFSEASIAVQPIEDEIPF